MKVPNSGSCRIDRHNQCALEGGLRVAVGSFYKATRFAGKACLPSRRCEMPVADRLAISARCFACQHCAATRVESSHMGIIFRGSPQSGHRDFFMRDPPWCLVNAILLQPGNRGT